MLASVLRRDVALIAVLITAPGSAAAQVVVQQVREDVPVITRVTPPGLVRGRINEVLVEGDRLDDVSQVVGPVGVKLAGVLEADAKRVKLRLDVAADARLGTETFYVLAKAGLSNPRLLHVDTLEQTIEHEDNNTVATATPATAPGAWSGVLREGDKDFFRFTARAGQRLVFDVEANRIGSAARPVLRLFDEAGREFASLQTPPHDVGPDLRLIHTFTHDGTYALCVHEHTYQGADFAAYYVRVGTIPFATAMFPLGGRRGSVVPVTIEGGSLASPVEQRIDLTGPITWRRTRFDVATPDGPITSPRWFAIGDYPEVVETEPNNEAAAAQAVSIPVTINGRMDSPRDHDCFRVALESNAKIVVRVIAQQLGSPFDSVVTIANASGAVLATADDRQRADRESPVVRPVRPLLLADALLEFTAPAKGEYVITLDDVNFRGGPEFAYRLEIAPPAAPDFELVAQPGRPLAVPAPGQAQQQQQGQRVLPQFAGHGTGSLSLDQGGNGEIVVRALRAGYAGPVELAVENLPDGVRAAPTTIPAGQTQASIIFTAGFDAASTVRMVRVTGKALVGQNVVTRAAEHPLVFSALPTNGAVELPIGEIAVGISRQRPELALMGEVAAPLVQGSAAPLRLSIKRRDGVGGDVSVRFASLPGGLSATPATIAADSEQSEIKLQASLGVQPGKRTTMLEATLQVKDRKEPIVARLPLDIDVLPVATVELLTPQVDLPERGTARLEFRVQRHGSLAAPIELAVAQLPAGVVAAPLAIPIDADTFTLTLTADENATASPIRRIVQVQAKAKVDDQTIDLPAARFALRVTKDPAAK
jgi:hypothetical protein